MSVQRVHLLTLTACVAIAAAALALRGEPPPRPAKPRIGALGAVPSGASFVLTLDVARLRESALGSALLSAGRELPGVGQLDAICGFDPSEEVREVAVAMPAGSAESELGIVIAGDLPADRIGECALRVIRKRGGNPSGMQLESFFAIRDRSGATNAEVLVRDGGPVIVGEGRYLRDMVDAAEGRAQNLRQDQTHAALRNRIEEAPIVATWLLDERWLERASGDELARLSPLSELRAAAVRLHVVPEVVLEAFLVCTSPTACERVAGVLRSFSRDLGPALREELGDDPLANAKIEQKGATIELSVGVASERLSAMARRLLTRWAAAPAATPTPSAPAMAPDQVLRP